MWHDYINLNALLIHFVSFQIMFNMFIIQIVLNIPHIQFLLINIVQMGCLINHEKVVKYTSLYLIQFKVIQVVYGQLGLWTYTYRFIQQYF